MLTTLVAYADEQNSLPSSIKYEGLEIPVVVIPVGEIRALDTNNISYDLPIYKLFATPSINQEAVAQYLNTLFSTTNEGNFRWGHALTYYAMNHNNAISNVLVRYVKAMMAKAHQFQISLPQARVSVDADIHELAYILTGNKEAAITFSQWRQEWNTIKNTVMATMPTVDALSLPMIELEAQNS